jgi:putative hydrolase
MHILQDFHVHSTFSDGKGSLEENLNVAQEIGLVTLGCVDHVRKDTTWVPQYVAAVAALRPRAAMNVLCGVEAKLLSEAGDVDVPSDLTGVDHIYIADHQLPLGSTCLGPRQVREEIDAGRLNANGVVRALVTATCNALHRHHHSVIAHLFSFLPKVGLTERDVSDDDLCLLASVARRTNALLEFDERWQSPGIRARLVFEAYEVPLVASSDAHRPQEIASYTWLPSLFEAATAL